MDFDDFDSEIDEIDETKGDHEAWKKALEEADNMGLNEEQTLQYVIAKMTERRDEKATYKEIDGKKYRLICNFSKEVMDLSCYPWKIKEYKIDAVRAAIEAHKECDLVLLNSQYTPKDYIGFINEPGWSLFCGLNTNDLSNFWSTVYALESLQG